MLAAGARPLHEGFGIWRGETHCVGWNAGATPLPLVLASDVAAAIRLTLQSDIATNHSYNLVGDVHLSARECVDELARALGRPLVFHSGHPAQHHALAVAKWSARKLAGRELPPFPAYRGFASKRCLSSFDCSDAKRDLGWLPVADAAEFLERAFRDQHASRSVA